MSTKTDKRTSTLEAVAEPTSRNKNLTNAGKGRDKGVPNKITVAVKQAIMSTFDGLGGVEGFTAWARKNRTEFYKIFARLIPTETPSSPLVSINIPVGQPITDANEAARVYAEIMRDPSIDLSGITFASPAALPSPAEPAAIVADVPSNAAPLPDHPLEARIAPRESGTVSEWERFAND